MSGALATSVYECPFKLKGAYPVTVDGGVVNVNSASSNVVTWFRIAIVTSAGTGASHESPKSFCSHVRSVFGSSAWRVNPSDETGHVTIRRDAGTTGTIVWGSGKGRIVRDLLGFTADITLAPAATIVAPNPPAYRILTIERRGDTLWQPVTAGGAFSESDGGKVSGVASRRLKTYRRFTLGLHPTTPASITAMQANTPALPSLEGAYAGRMVLPTEDLESTPSTVPVPFTVLDFFAAARGRQLAMKTNFQELIAQTSPYFDEVYLDAKTCNEGPFMNLKDARWSELMDVGPWTFLLRNARQTIGG